MLVLYKKKSKCPGSQLILSYKYCRFFKLVNFCWGACIVYERFYDYALYFILNMQIEEAGYL